MDSLTQDHLMTLRNALSYRLGELRAEVAADGQARAQAAAPGTPEVADHKDQAQAMQDEALMDVQERRDRDELARVLAALGRLDHGVYGDCMDCGEPIALPRLLVQPAAERCAACQVAFEHARDRAPQAW